MVRWLKDSNVHLRNECILGSEVVLLVEVVASMGYSVGDGM